MWYLVEEWPWVGGASRGSKSMLGNIAGARRSQHALGQGVAEEIQLLRTSPLKIPGTRADWDLVMNEIQ